MTPTPHGATTCSGWPRPPTAPADLADRLAAAGVPQVEPVTGMHLDLDGWAPRARPAGGVGFAEVGDAAGLAAHEDLIVRYWELDEAERAGSCA